MAILWASARHPQRGETHATGDPWLRRHVDRSGRRRVRRAPRGLERDRRPPARAHRPLRECGRRRGSDPPCPRGGPRDRGEVRRPQRHGPLGSRRRPDDRPLADVHGHRRSRRPARRRRGRRAPSLPRPRVAGTRARHHGGQRLAHRGRWPHARWRHGMARASGGPRVRQRRALHARHRRRRDRPRDRVGGAGAVLGPSRRRRQLRRRDRVHVPAAPGRRACAGRRAHLPRGRRPRADAPLARPAGRRAAAGDPDGRRRDRRRQADGPDRLCLGRRPRRCPSLPADDAQHRQRRPTRASSR